MADNKEKGCVKTEIDVEGIPPSVQCNTTSNIQYLRSELNNRADELALALGANKVFVDSCTDFGLSTSWVIIAISIAAGAIILALGIFFFVSCRFRRSQRGDLADPYASKVPYYKVT